RKAACDRGSDAGAGSDLHRATVQFHEALDDGKTEACASAPPAIGARLEAAEDRVHDVLRDARPVIVDVEDKAVRAAPAAKHDVRSFRRVVGGVAEQV